MTSTTQPCTHTPLNALHACSWMLQLLHLAAMHPACGVTWWHYQVHGRKGSVPNINKLSYKHWYMYESTDDTLMYRSNSLTLVLTTQSNFERWEAKTPLQNTRCTIQYDLTFHIHTYYAFSHSSMWSAVHQVDNPVHRSNTSLMAICGHERS